LGLCVKITRRHDGSSRGKPATVIPFAYVWGIDRRCSARPHASEESPPQSSPVALAALSPLQPADAVVPIVPSGDQRYALYQKLAEEAERWQAEADPDRVGHYAAVIDYVVVSMDRWTNEEQLRELAIAAGYARDKREQIVKVHQIVVPTCGVVAAAMAMILQKIYTDPMLILVAVIVGAIFYLIAQLISVAIGQKRNEDRAKDWKTLHQALLKKLEAARNG